MKTQADTIDSWAARVFPDEMRAIRGEPTINELYGKPGARKPGGGEPTVPQLCETDSVRHRLDQLRRTGRAGGKEWRKLMKKLRSL